MPTRYMKGFDKPLPVELVSFAMDGWGTTLRYGKLSMDFKVKDAERFHDCQKWVGHHFSLVYGDYCDAVAVVAEDYGMTVLRA